MTQLRADVLLDISEVLEGGAQVLRVSHMADIQELADVKTEPSVPLPHSAMTGRWPVYLPRRHTLLIPQLMVYNEGAREEL